MPDTYDLSTDIGKVRLKIADTNTANTIFSDAEIQSFISQTTSLNEAAAHALLANAADRSRLATRKSAGNYSEDLSKIADSLRALAKDLLDVAHRDDGVADDYSEMDWDGVGGLAYKERIVNENLRGNS